MIRRCAWSAWVISDCRQLRYWRTKGTLFEGLKLIRVVETINSGGVHIIEPDLEEEYVEKAVTAGKLRAPLPQKADIYITCVPTPFYDEEL